MKTTFDLLVPVVLFVTGVVGCGAACGDDLERQAAGNIASEASAATADQDPSRTSTVRSFVFHYDFRLHDLLPGAAVKVWVPVPQTDAWQTVSGGDIHADALLRETVESEYGNHMHYFEITVPETGSASSECLEGDGGP